MVSREAELSEAGRRVPRYPGVLSDDGLMVLFTHPGDAQWTEVVSVEHLEEVEKDPPRRRRWK